MEKAVLMLVECVRKKCHNPKPLIWHSIKIGAQLYQMGQPKVVIVAGILHDLLEDTGCRLSQIKRKFGPKVAKLIKACTTDYRIKNYQKRWHKLLANIKKIGQGAMLIKILDANDNLSFVRLIKDSDKLKKTLWKHQFVIKSFKPLLGSLQIFKEYQENVNKIMKEFRS